jgi:ABC-type antimicrobial peptide transport system permease subunit
MRQALGLVALGLAAGVPLAIGVSYALQEFLFQVATASPLIVVAASAVLALAATVAAIVPALRAGRTDPIEALRAR